jgi:pilus assembly protein CpaB
MFLLIAITVAGLAALAVYSALKKKSDEVGSAAIPTTEIVIAAHDLPLGVRIDTAAVKVVRWPRDLMPAGALNKKEAALGSIVVSPLLANEPLVSGKLLSADRRSGLLPVLIPLHMRAMSVAVDEVGDIAGFVLPHSRVDVLVALSQHDAGKGTAIAEAKIVLEDTEVLAVAQTVEHKDQPQVEKVVTLLVTPEEAERLALVSHEGTLRLALRGYSDHDVVTTSGSDLSQIFDAYNVHPAQSAPTPVGRIRQSAARRLHPDIQIEVIRDGRKRQTLGFNGDQAVPSSPERDGVPPTQHQQPTAEIRKASVSSFVPQDEVVNGREQP